MRKVAELAGSNITYKRVCQFTNANQFWLNVAAKMQLGS